MGNVIIKQIRDRTQSGTGVSSNGREYNLGNKPYTKGYASQKGVSRSDVDLTLSGDMLENMYVKNVKDGSVDISVRERDYGKLRGAEEGIWVNNRDSRGKAIPGTGKLVKRQFFHLSSNYKKKIKNDSDFRRILERAVKRNLK